ncbi:MAG TPA: hypothetical protein VNM89_03460, partial [Solirubrobacterales bacterium]|nr:hypothetical protein [Solirubrobacterales bacterium]
SAEAMTPAAGQGALVLQARAEDEASRDAVAKIGDDVSLRELTAERTVVGLLEATCATPIGVQARIAANPEKAAGEVLTLDAFVGLPDGSEWLRDRIEGDAHRPEAVGKQLAERLLSAGARDILDRAEDWSERGGH